MLKTNSNIIYVGEIREGIRLAKKLNKAIFFKQETSKDTMKNLAGIILLNDCVFIETNARDVLNYLTYVGKEELEQYSNINNRNLKNSIFGHIVFHKVWQKVLKDSCIKADKYKEWKKTVLKNNC